MARPLRIFLIGLALAVVIAFVGRGSAEQFIVGIYLAAGSIIAAGLSLAVGWIRSRDYRAAAVAIAAVGVLQLASIPLGALLNRMDIDRARAWCEETPPPADGNELTEAQAADRPAIAEYTGGVCIVRDRAAIMHWWEYDPATGQWREMD
jgi:hypothetical protein